LAIGNIVGSAISNILGAFSLGLLFHPKGKPIEFDRSSRIYSLLLLVLTTFVTPITYFSGKVIWLVCGAILIALFAIYIGSVGWAISKGTLTAPEDSDDDSSSGNSVVVDITTEVAERTSVAERTPVAPNANEATSTESAIAESSSSPVRAGPSRTTRRRRYTLRYHISYLFLGFLAICLAGYILSQAATTITDEFRISDVLFGVIILAIATTLPEKFVAIMSGHRGRIGILVANTVGSNIFLLTLCAGIVMLDTSGKFGEGNVKIAELGVLWVSTLAFTLTVWFGGRYCWWIGAAMLLAYVAFIVLEFTVIHSVTKDEQIM
jgi:Ca2+/Na+ antiporter